MCGKCYIALWLIVLLMSMGACQDLAVEISLHPERIYYGEQAQLKIEVNGGDASASVDLAKLGEDFTVEDAGSQSQNRTFIHIVNGEERRSEFRGHLFAYTLSPKKAGKFVIGPLNVVCQGKRALSNRVTLEVIGMDRQDLAFLRIVSGTGEDRECFLGENFTVTIEVYLKKLDGSYADYDPIAPRSPLSLKIPWLSGIEGVESPSLQEVVRPYLARQGKAGFHINDIATRSDSMFSMFDEPTRAVFALPRRQVKTMNPAGSEGVYWCYTLPLTMRARKTGSYTFGPALLKGMAVRQSSSDAQPEGKEIVCFAESLVIQVKDAPLAGRPSSFCGGVGQFSVRAEAVPKELYVGDPLTLALHVDGEGFWDNLLPPKIGQYPELAEHFTVYDDKVTSEQRAQGKTFRYALRVRTATVREIPPLPFAYFDPKTRRYVVIHTPSLPLSVKAAPTLNSGEVISGAPTASANQETLQKQSRGIMANYTKDDILVAQEIGWQAWHIAVLAGWPLLYLLSASWIYYRRRMGSDPVYRRRSRAWKLAQQRIAAAGGDELATYAAWRAAILGEVADLYNLPAESLVPAEALEHMRHRQVSDDLLRETADFLELCEAMQYGLHASQGATLDETRQKVLALGEKIGKL